jgi:hypothetical protein
MLGVGSIIPAALFVTMLDTNKPVRIRVRHFARSGRPAVVLAHPGRRCELVEQAISYPLRTRDGSAYRPEGTFRLAVATTRRVFGIMLLSIAPLLRQGHTRSV